MKNGKYKQEFYFKNKEFKPYELSYLTDLQIQNSVCNVLSSERYLHGYLNFLLTEKSLSGIKNIHLLEIAMQNRSKKIIGFAYAMPNHIAKNIPHLVPLIKEFQTYSKNYFLMSVCVKKEFRKRGVGGELLRRVTLQAQLGHGDCAFVELGICNLLGEKFFMREGFSSSEIIKFPDRKILYKPLKTLERIITPHKK